MAILFRKQVQKFGFGGDIPPTGAEDGLSKMNKRNPYRQDEVYSKSSKYIGDLINKNNPNAISAEDNGYSYNVQPNQQFVSGFNANSEGTYGGSDDDVMFNVTPGRHYVPGPSLTDPATSEVVTPYHQRSGAGSYPVTVGQYRTNPGAFRNLGGGYNFNQYNSYLGTK